MLRKLSHLPGFLRNVRMYQRSYGVFNGARLALQVRRVEHARAGTLLSVDVPKLPSPIRLRAKTSDGEVFHSIFGEQHLRCSLSEEPKFIVDAGAYIGISSIYLSQRFPTARVIALEFESSNYALLKTNTGAYQNIVPLHRALWSGRARLKVANPSDERWSFRATEASPGDTATVEAVGVADILDEFECGTIDLLKIDIEGSEKEVFGVAAESWIDHVKVIAIELHDRVNPGCEAAVRGAIGGRKFDLFRQGEYFFFVQAGQTK